MRRACLLALALASAAVATALGQEPARITRIEFRPATEAEGSGVIISLLGSGRCTYSIDFGDGKNDQRTAQLPDRIQHVYPSDGEYEVAATPEAPCEGVARAKIAVRAIERGIWSLSAEPGATPGTLELVVTVNGRGSCAVTLDFGDGAIEKAEGALPVTRSHKYANTGTYDIRATTTEPCRGEAQLKVEITR
nr:PKD domain protein [uncultured bacterium]